MKSVLRLDTRSLALFRIALGTVLLVDLVGRAIDLRAHYTDSGVLPLRELFDWLGPQAYFTPHAWLGVAWWPVLLFGIAAMAALALLVGYRTRLATVVCWLLTISLQARNPVIAHGGDSLLRILLLWSTLLPLGARWSVDAAGNQESRGSVSSPATLGILLQISLMYWFSALLKWNPTWMQEALAIDMALNVDYLTTDAGRLLLGNTDLTRILSPAIVWFELLGPLLLWSPWKTGPLRFGLSFAFISFHLFGLGVAFHLGFFPWIAATAWLLVLPTWMWNRLAGVSTPSNSRSPTRRSIDLRTGRRVEALTVGTLLVLALVWNIQSVAPDERAWMTPPPLDVIGRILGINQRWQTFAPTPPADDGWYVMPAQTIEGKTIDAWTGAELSWVKPEDVAASFGSKRWNKYLANLSTVNYRYHRPLFGAFLCAERHRLERFEMLFLLERFDSPGEMPEALLLWEQTCPSRP